MITLAQLKDICEYHEKNGVDPDTEVWIGEFRVFPHVHMGSSRYGKIRPIITFEYADADGKLILTGT